MRKNQARSAYSSTLVWYAPNVSPSSYGKVSPAQGKTRSGRRTKALQYLAPQAKHSSGGASLAGRSRQSFVPIDRSRSRVVKRGDAGRCGEGLKESLMA